MNSRDEWRTSQVKGRPLDAAEERVALDVFGVVREHYRSGVNVSHVPGAKGLVMQERVVVFESFAGETVLLVIEESHHEVHGIARNRHERDPVNVWTGISLLGRELQVATMFLS
jgi:hypothetical protein